MVNNSIVFNDQLNFNPDLSEPVFKSIFEQYEKVIIESLITSFGLDFILKDKYGGDVDTIHNVRQIGKDKEMVYKNKSNEKDYENCGEYNSREYHSHKKYVEKNREVSKQKKNGTLIDAYTGEKIESNGKSDLDHVISANEIHNDPGRVLSGLKGVDLANCEENLKATNPRTNRTKKANTMDEFHEKYKNEYTEEQLENMKNIDLKARKSYEAKLAKKYYTSPTFVKDMSSAAAKVGVGMGVRQAMGFVFTEIWFEVKDEFVKSEQNAKFNLEDLLNKISNGIKKGVENSKAKYKDLFDKFLEGISAGFLSSITTTLCNIFFTTAKNTVKIIRQSYASLVKAAEVLFINPDNYTFGQRINEVTKIISTGASVVVGVIASEAISKTPIGTIPLVGEIVETFCGTLVTGIMSCTLLYLLDRNEKINKLIKTLDNMHTIETEINYYRQQAIYFEEYAAKLMNIEIDSFKKEVDLYNNITLDIENANSYEEVNLLLKEAYKRINIEIPWEGYGDFDSFMKNKKVKLVFE